MKSATITKKIYSMGGNFVFAIPKAISEYLKLEKGEMIEVKITKLEGDDTE